MSELLSRKFSIKKDSSSGSNIFVLKLISGNILEEVIENELGAIVKKNGLLPNGGLFREEMMTADAGVISKLGGILVPHEKFQVVLEDLKAKGYEIHQ